MEKVINEYELFDPYKLEWDQEIEFPSTRKIKEYGNRIYNRYPARSICLVPRAILAKYTGRNINVLDPFMGSGTTAVETVLSGNNAFGVEMNPFSRMIADVSTSVYTDDEFIEIENFFHVISKLWHTCEPAKVPMLTGISRWFEKDVFTDLLKLYTCIKENVSLHLQPFFLCVFADCIKPSSLMERQSTKPYISKKYKKIYKPAFESFEYSYNAHIKPLKEMSGVVGNKGIHNINWIGNNATDFFSEEIQIDIAITSPPYINAFDYTQCVKVESAMCGILNDNLAKELRSVQVGHELRRHQIINEDVQNIFAPYYALIKSVDINSANTCLGYFNDIRKNLICVYKILKTGGEYHIIIGDSIIKKVNIPTHVLIAKIAETIGFSWIGNYKYAIKDHRTSIPRDQETSKIKYEFVIVLKK